MSFWAELRAPAQCEALVAVYETRWLSLHAEKAGSLDRVLEVMAGYFALTGTIVEEAGGRQVKILGDAGLAVFPAARSDDAVAALSRLRVEGGGWLADQGTRCPVVVKADLGPVILGMVGAPGHERLEVYGKPVAAAYMLPSTGFAMTAPVFRSLSPEGRKPFRKHTPPVSYIGIEDNRPRP